MEKIKMQFGSLTLNEEVINRLDELDYTPESLSEVVEAQRNNDDGPRVYVGTYAKYNAGNICGLWVNLTDFTYYDDFINFCKAIHADEDEPELMFQDFDNFPRKYYSESSLDKVTYDNICEYGNLCEQYEPETIDYFVENMDHDINDFEECYQGRYASEEDFAREIVDGCYDLDKIMGSLSCYFDYEAFARDLFACDYEYDAATGAVFWRH